MNALELKNQKATLDQINKQLDSKSVAVVDVRITAKKKAEIAAVVSEYTDNISKRGERALLSVKLGALLLPYRQKFMVKNDKGVLGLNKKAWGAWIAKSPFAAVRSQDFTDLCVLGENKALATKVIKEAHKNGTLAGSSPSYLRKLVLDTKKADDKEKSEKPAKERGAQSKQGKNLVTPASLVAELIAKMTKNEISKQAIADELKKHGF